METRKQVWRALRRLAQASPIELGAALDELFTADTTYHGPHPFNELHGRRALEDVLWLPLKKSFPDLDRRDDILISDRCEGADWMSATGYYYGTFKQDYLGIRATQNWVYIRFGEFYRLEAGQIAESYSIIDFVDLMRQAGVYPLPVALGIETLTPPPACQDGIVLTPQDPLDSAKSRELVNAMISGLFQFDGKDSASMCMDRYWNPDMMWYARAASGRLGAWPDF